MTTTAQEFFDEFHDKTWDPAITGAFLTKLFGEFDSIDETDKTGVYAISFQDGSSILLDNTMIGTVNIEIDEEEPDEDDNSDEDRTSDPV